MKNKDGFNVGQPVTNEQVMIANKKRNKAKPEKAKKAPKTPN